MLVATGFAVCAQGSKKIKVLFIGNSYTAVNNLPQLVHDIALANGDTLVFDSYSPGGYTFNGHYNDPQAKSKIAAGGWRYVVLQAQSQEPSFSPQQVAAQTLPYAVKLDSIVKHHNPCATTVYYETWGRKNGDASNCPIYPPVCTYSGMQNRLRASYKLFADSVKGIVAPAGEAFRLCIAQNPTLNLYMADESHPSLEGSYLTAAVFYEVLFGKSVVSNTFLPNVSPVSAMLMRQVAHTIVNDSLSTWNIGLHSPMAQFSVSAQGGGLWQFTPTSPGNNHLWYYGNGVNSAGPVGAYTYTAAGTYTVSHVHLVGCSRDSLTSVITVTVPVTTSLTHGRTEAALNVAPNPFINYLQVQLHEGQKAGEVQIKLYAVTGELVLKSDQALLNTSALPAGVYFAELRQGNSRVVTRLIKAAD